MQDTMQLNIYKKTEEIKEGGNRQFEKQVKLEAQAVTTLKKDMLTQRE
jgi:hypothetical protein